MYLKDFESHRPPSTPAPTTPALPTPLRPPPLRPPAVPAPYHTGPLRYRPPTEAILCEYSDCMYTQLLKLRYWISSPVKKVLLLLVIYLTDNSKLRVMYYIMLCIEMWTLFSRLSHLNQFMHLR